MLICYVLLCSCSFRKLSTTLLFCLCSGGDDELAVRGLAVLLPLARTAVSKPLPLLGYGELPPSLTLVHESHVLYLYGLPLPHCSPPNGLHLLIEEINERNNSLNGMLM